MCNVILGQNKVFEIHEMFGISNEYVHCFIAPLKVPTREWNFPCKTLYTQETYRENKGIHINGIIDSIISIEIKL